MPKGYVIAEIVADAFSLIPMIINIIWLFNDTDFWRNLLKFSIVGLNVIWIITLTIQIMIEDWHKDHTMGVSVQHEGGRGAPIAVKVSLIGTYLVLSTYWFCVVAQYSQIMQSEEILDLEQEVSGSDEESDDVAEILLPNEKKKTRTIRKT